MHFVQGASLLIKTLLFPAWSVVSLSDFSAVAGANSKCKGVGMPKRWHCEMMNSFKTIYTTAKLTGVTTPSVDSQQRLKSATLLKDRQSLCFSYPTSESHSQTTSFTATGESSQSTRLSTSSHFLHNKTNSVSQNRCIVCTAALHPVFDHCIHSSFTRAMLHLLHHFTFVANK